MANKWRKSPPELIALFDAALPDDRRVERRKMFGYPAGFVGGRLFAGLHQETVVLKLDAPDRETLARDHGGVRFEPTPGRRMGAFMAAPPSLLVDPSRLRPWLDRALRHVASTEAPSSGGASSRKPAKRRGSAG